MNPTALSHRILLWVWLYDSTEKVHSWVHVLICTCYRDSANCYTGLSVMWNNPASTSRTNPGHCHYNRSDIFQCNEPGVFIFYRPQQHQKTQRVWYREISAKSEPKCRFPRGKDAARYVAHKYDNRGLRLLTKSSNMLDKKVTESHFENLNVSVLSFSTLLEVTLCNIVPNFGRFQH